MSVTEIGYQNYEMYNVTNDGETADLNQIVLSPESNSSRIVASEVVNGVTSVIEMQGSFAISGNSLANVTGTMSSITVNKNGNVFFSDSFSNGADFQAWINDYGYNMSLLSGNDRFIGSSTQAINDAIQTLDGNDVFTGYGDNNGQWQSGGDHFYGGNGIDTAVFRGNHDQYVISKDVSMQDARTEYSTSIVGDTVTDTVSNRDGVDKLVDVERLQFADTNVALDVGLYENAGMAYRIYRAAFDRAPDEVGLANFIAALDQGVSPQAIANEFTHSAEFQTLYGTNISNADFVELLYQNALDRPSDAVGKANWVAALESGQQTRADLLIGFSESAENYQATIGLIGQGLEYPVLG